MCANKLKISTRSETTHQATNTIPFIMINTIGLKMFKKLFIVVAMVVSLTGMSIAAESGTTRYITVPKLFVGKDIQKFKNIGEELVKSNYKTYILNWQGDGGLVTAGKAFISKVEEAKSQGKRVIFRLQGGSYSMHALSVCYGSSVEGVGTKLLMFHADGYSQFRSSKSHSSIVGEINHCVQVGLLKQSEADKMWQGYEVWKVGNKVKYVKETREII